MTTTSPDHSSSILRILCVDDEPDIRAVLELALRMDPLIEVRSAGSAKEALALLNQREWMPDLALLDMMMPEMNGCQLAAAMRASDHMANITIIFVSANDQPSDLAQYRAVGAMGFIRKPFDPLTMARHVRDHLTGAVTSLSE